MLLLKEIQRVDFEECGYKPAQAYHTVKTLDLMNQQIEFFMTQAMLLIGGHYKKPSQIMWCIEHMQEINKKVLQIEKEGAGQPLPLSAQ